MVNNRTAVNGTNDLLDKEKEKRGIIQRFIVWMALFGFWIFFSIASDKFFQVSNFIAILRDAAILGIISCGLTVVIISGGIDLSIGSLAGISGLVASALILKGWNGFLVVFIFSMAVCLVIGYINGIMINIVKIPALIATLAMMMILKGVKLVSYGSQDMFLSAILPSWLYFMSKQFIGPVPVSIFFFAAVCILTGIILYKTPFGRKVYAVGADDTVAYLMGIKPSRVRILTYLFLSALVWLSSTLAVGRIGGYSFSLGQNYEMRAILAVIMGGTAFTGGRGTIEGSIAGVILVATLNNGLTLMRIPYAWQAVILGMIFILVVGVDSYYHRYEE